MAIALFNAMRSPDLVARRIGGHGFNLLEIMVVIALVSLLTTGVAVGALKMLRESEEKQARTDAANLAAAAEAFLVAQGSEECPAADELKRDGILSRRSKTDDPWGTPYRISCEPDAATVMSAGCDGIFGTGDDIRPDEP